MHCLPLYRCLTLLTLCPRNALHQPFGFAETRLDQVSSSVHSTETTQADAAPRRSSPHRSHSQSSSSTWCSLSRFVAHRDSQASKKRIRKEYMGLHIDLHCNYAWLTDSQAESFSCTEPDAINCTVKSASDERQVKGSLSEAIA